MKNTPTEFKKLGDKITGEYCNQPFSGIVTQSRANSMSFKMEYRVELDTPLEVYGQTRHVIFIDGGK